MSAKNPIIAITGSSGAGTTTTTSAIKHIFRSLNIQAAFIEGDSFHRYTRPEMDKKIREAQQENKHMINVVIHATHNRIHNSFTRMAAIRSITY